jgi:hypothetical protein
VRVATGAVVALIGLALLIRSIGEPSRYRADAMVIVGAVLVLVSAPGLLGWP